MTRHAFASHKWPNLSVSMSYSACAELLRDWFEMERRFTEQSNPMKIPAPA